MTKFWTITCSLALFLESCLGHQSDNKQYSTDYHRIIDSIAENYLKNLNADSLAVYIYHRSGVSLAFAAIGSGVKMRIPELLGFYAEVATIEKSDKWSVNTMEEIHSMLRAVVSNGTATNLKSETVSVSGKTATYRTYGDTGYNYEGRFIGFNENQPNHIVMARVFNSKNKIHGSLTAGPIVADVIKGLHSESISKSN